MPLVPGCFQEMGPPMSNSAPKPPHSTFPVSSLSLLQQLLPLLASELALAPLQKPGEAVMVQAPPLYPVQGPEQPSLHCGTASLLPDTNIMLTSDFLGADSLLALDYLGVQPGNTLY